MKFRSESWRTRGAGAVAVSGLIATVAACSGSAINPASSSTTTTQTTTTVSAPTMNPTAPKGAAVNAQYWSYQVQTLDTKTQEFADSYAKEFCEKPKVAHLDARMISMGTALGVLSIPYALRHKDYPAWQNDSATQTKIAYYIVSNYCPEQPE